MNLKLIALAFGLAAAVLAADPGSAPAAPSDTVISVFYASKAVRVRPRPNQGGTGHVTFRIVLHANGTVEDAFENKDGPKGKMKTKLGKQPRGAVYRVIDASTIERTAEEPTHFHKLTIKVNGKNCTANVDYTLKPGQTEYRGYSTELKQWAYYSKMEMEYATCVIE